MAGSSGAHGAAADDFHGPHVGGPAEIGPGLQADKRAADYARLAASADDAGFRRSGC